MTQQFIFSQKKIGQLKQALVMSAMGLMVTACAAPQAIPGPSINNSQITISESIERLELYARPNGMSLSSRDQSAVAEFLAAYGQFGDGPLYINVPGAQSGSIGTQQSAQLVRQTMAQMGMGVGAIQSGQYQSNPAAPSPVVVSYRRMKVVPQDCRTLANLMDTHANRPMPSFGCAYHANLGAMKTGQWLFQAQPLWRRSKPQVSPRLRLSVECPCRRHSQCRKCRSLPCRRRRS